MEKTFTNKQFSLLGLGSWGAVFTFLMLWLSLGISSVQAQTDAMRLNGSTWLDSDINGSTINVQNFTMETWVRTTTTADQKIINVGSHHPIATISGNARLCMQSGCASGTAINDGNWHHLAVSYDVGNSRWFLTVDGVQALTDNSGPTGNFATLIELGGLTSFAFVGDVDEMRIWNTNKTEAEIAASMNTCLTGSETNLVAYYTFDDPSNRLRNLVTNANATIGSGSPTYVTDGPTLTCNNALSFDGGDHVELPSSTVSMNSDKSSTFTIEAWVKGNNTQTNGYVYGEGNNSTNTPIFGLIAISGKIRVILRNDVSTSSFDSDVTSTSDVFDNSWHHIAYTYSNGTASLYVDGVEDASDFSFVPSATSFTANRVALGALLRTNTAGHFIGEIDEVRIWNDIRTCSEIKANMNKELTGSETGLVTYYQFNEGSGTNLPDIASANGTQNGTLGASTATPTWVTGSTGITGVTNVLPEINVQGNSNNITGDDSNVPNTTNDTDFGTVSTSKVLTYTIENTGGADLSVSAINITGTHSSDFVVGGITFPATIAGGANTTFTVTFTPGAVGTRTASVEISNDDCDESTYIFDIQGTGEANNALNFDGSDDEVRATGFSAVTAYTIEGWFKPNSTTDQSLIVGTNGNPTSSWSHQIRISSNRFQHYLFDGSLKSIDANTMITTNEWYHVAIVAENGGNMRMYINGVLQTSTSSVGTLWTGLNQFHFGSNSGNGMSHFDGEMDEVRIWNDVRTCAEIQANMNNEIANPASEANLVAYYNFNEGSGTNLPDLKGSNNGTLQNFNFLGTSSDWVTGSTGITSSNTGTASEINVQFEGTSVADGGTADFGAVGTESKTFTIQNTGGANLNISNVAISGAGFSVSGITTPANIAGSSDLTFTVTFSKTGTNGSKTGTLTITNNDCDESSYVINLSAEEINETTDGVRGSMMSFDGSSERVTTSLDVQPSALPTTTWEAWIYVGSDITTHQQVLSTDDAGFDRFIAFRNGFYYIGVGSAWEGFVAPLTEQWQHIAVVFEPSDVKFYLNGVEYVRGSAPTGGATARNLTIGNYPSGSDIPFDGNIDEVRIWNVARTEAEIRENMHLTLKGSETGLVAYYQFNEASGDAIDKVSGNNGTLENGATRVDSEVAVASGTSKRVSVTSGSTGTDEVDLSTTNMAIDFGGGTNPNGELVIYQLEGEPYAQPTTPTAIVSSYWIVRNFATNSGLDIDEITFQVPSGDVISGEDEMTPSNFKIYKRGSSEIGTWNETDALAISADNSTKQVVFNTSSSGDFSSFSQFVVGTTGSTGLPITLLDFNAQRANEKQVLLTWATALEKDNAGFEIEMSTDGENFEKVEFVAGAGNSSEIKNYQLSINNSDAGYYRLKQIDFDGSFEYSDLRFVAGVKITRSLGIAPNPTNGKVRLSLENTEEHEIFTLRLLDSKGQAILDTKGNLNQINEHLNSILGRASKGLYFLEVQSERERFMERIILQ